MEVVTVRSLGGIVYEVLCDSETKVCCVVGNEAPVFAIGFICEGSWYYQGLHWNCRGGKLKYYRAMVILYRYLRRHRLTDHSLRYMAWGDRRLRNHGYAIRTKSWRELTESRAKFEVIPA